MNGWYKQHRNLSGRAWFQDAQMVQLYHYLKERAYVADGRFEGKVIRRGSCPVTRSELSEITGMSLKTLDRKLKKLISYGEIIVKGNNRFSVITVCDYNTFGDSESLFGTAGDTASDIANDTTTDTASDTTLIYNKEERIKEDKNILVSSPYKKEREKEEVAYEIKNRYNKRFASKLPPCIRLTMPTKQMVGECIRRFGMQAIDLVFDQVEAEPFSMGNNKTGFIANFQFIFDPKNFQGYLERAQLHKQKKVQPQQKKSVGVIADEPQRQPQTDDQRRKSFLELIDYVKSNPRSLSCVQLEGAYRSGELQRLGIDWKPNNI